MIGIGRQLGITVVAYLCGLGTAALAILGMIDVNTISLDSGLPKIAMTTPMLAVVVFWGVARIAGANIAPVRIFLLGGIAIYSLFYLCGLLVANQILSNSAATVLGACALFLLAFITVGSDRRMSR